MLALATRELLLVNQPVAVISLVAPLLWLAYVIAGVLKEKTILYFLPVTAVAGVLLIMEVLLRLSLFLGWEPLPHTSLKPAFPLNHYQIPLFDRPAAVADSISGYRWADDSVSVLKISNNTIEYVNKFSGNEAGFHAGKQYVARKKAGAFRIAVLGDSFTDAFFLKTPWTEKWEQSLKARHPELEVYSFGINGGGIVNWHRLFFKELLPAYEVDALVLAIFGNNLARDFFTMHHNESFAYLKYFEGEPPKDLIHDLQQTKGMRNIVTHRHWERILHLYQTPSFWSSPTFMIYHAIINGAYQWKKVLQYAENENYLVKQYIQPSGEAPSAISIRTKYGEKLKQLEEIIAACNSKNIDLYLFCVPEKEGALISSKGGMPQIAAELAYLSKEHQIPFWNGYLPYKEMEPSVIASHFMAPDGHWNQIGSDYFAAKIPFFTLLPRRDNHH